MVAVWLNIWSDNFINTGDWFLSNLLKDWCYRSVWRQCHLIACVFKYRLFIVEHLSICSAYDFLLLWCTIMQIVCSEVRCVCLIRASHCSYLCNTKQKATVSLVIWFGHNPHRWRFWSLNGLGTRTLDLGELLEFCCNICTLRWGAPFRSNALTVLLGWAGLLDYAQIGWFCALVTCLLCFVNGIQQLVQGGSLVKRGSNQTAWV
jgi:hypothetical protein